MRGGNREIDVLAARRAVVTFRKLIPRVGREKGRIGGIGEDFALTNASYITGRIQNDATHELRTQNARDTS